jgi:RNA polymerase sigma-70 factor (ECF subfamily)
MGAPLDERALVEKVLKGEERAKYDFYQAYKQKLYSFCVYTLGSNDPEIEDILQEVFLAAFQKLSQFEFRSSLDTWLTQICLHKCYRRFRRRGRLYHQAEEELEGLMQSKALEAAAKAEKEKEQKAKLEIVDKALARMGDPCRRILELRSKEDASYVEISQALKVPLGTVMSRLARCTAALKEQVEKLLKEGLK